MGKKYELVGPQKIDVLHLHGDWIDVVKNVIDFLKDYVRTITIDRYSIVVNLINTGEIPIFYEDYLVKIDGQFFVYTKEKFKKRFREIK